MASDVMRVRLHLRQTIHELQHKSWDAKERLTEWIEGDAPASTGTP